jgi:hypothetical protein
MDNNAQLYAQILTVKSQILAMMEAVNAPHAQAKIFSNLVK